MFATSKKRFYAGFGAVLISASLAFAAPASSATIITAKCQVVQFKFGVPTVIGHVYGKASNWTDAKKDANRYVPRGAYKRHCNDVNNRFSSGFVGAGGSSGF